MDKLSLTGAAFVEALWRIHWPGGNWLAVMYREPEGPWRIDSRFEYGGRHQSWYRVQPPECDNAEAIRRKIDETAQVIADMKQRQNDGRYRIRVHRSMVQGGPKDLMRVLAYRHLGYRQEVRH